MATLLIATNSSQPGCQPCSKVFREASEETGLCPGRTETTLPNPFCSEASIWRSWSKLSGIKELGMGIQLPEHGGNRSLVENFVRVRLVSASV